jgi:hypothetical protein
MGVFVSAINTYLMLSFPLHIEALQTDAECCIRPYHLHMLWLYVLTISFQFFAIT